MKDNLKDIFEYVDSHQEEFIGELGELCSFQSTAAQPQELEKTRSWLLERLRRAGVSEKMVPIDGGNALITGKKEGSSSRTVLFYNHYDVVESGKAEYWRSGNPFQMHQEGNMIFARGISDNKGPLLARIHAVQSILQVRNELPVNVKFLMEGDEETSSPSMTKYQQLMPEDFRHLTESDICFWENGRIDAEGHPWARFGVRGACAFNLSVRTANKDVHGRLGATIPSASWRLIWALASLKDSNEKILIDGFYDDILPTTEEEQRVLEQFPYNEETVKKELEISSFLLSQCGNELKKRIYTEPTLSVCGIETGELYNGPRGIVPHKAWARISFYLVANQNPEKVNTLLRDHLDKHGFSDVDVEYLGGTWPVKTPVNIPEATTLKLAAKEVYDQPLVQELTQLGSGPVIVVRRAWPELPVVGIGPGNTESNHHAPDENLRITDYIQSIKFLIAFMYEYME